MSNESTSKTTEKRSVLILSKDGCDVLPASVPTDLTVGEALDSIAEYAGFDPMPAAVRAVRYSLWAAPPRDDIPLPGVASDAFEALADGRTFGELPEHSVLCIAPQPRPAA